MSATVHRLVTGGDREREGAAVAERLVKRWREAGDRRARDELVERSLPLARRLAGRYQSPHEPLEDLVQVACLGLLGAVDRFDPDRGIPFRSFAIPTIIGELKRHFRNTGWTAHVPRGAQELALRVDRAAHQIEERTGRSPTPGDVAEFLELSLEDVLTGIDAGTAHFYSSLDAPIREGSVRDNPKQLADTVGGADGRYDLVDTKLSVASAIARLPYRERTALRLRLEGDLKQTEIAERMGCSQMQVSRLLRSAARQVREEMDPHVRIAP